MTHTIQTIAGPGNNPDIRVLHVTASIGKESFGLGQVVVNLTKAEDDLTGNAQIWCLNSDDQIAWAINLPGLAREKVSGFPRLTPGRLGISRAMLAAARTNGGAFDVVHQHGIWTACSHVSNTLCRVHGIPTVVAPHGSLQKWALKRSPWKKRLALLAYERENLHQAACLHATAEAEIADFRDYGLANPIAVIPNGISTTWIASQGDGARFREQYGIPLDRRLLLFLSRITPKRGYPFCWKQLTVSAIDFLIGSWLLQEPMSLAICRKLNHLLQN